MTAKEIIDAIKLEDIHFPSGMGKMQLQSQQKDLLRGLFEQGHKHRFNYVF